jgi:hypothetical protein
MGHPTHVDWWMMAVGSVSTMKTILTLQLVFRCTVYHEAVAGEEMT